MHRCAAGWSLIVGMSVLAAGSAPTSGAEQLVVTAVLSTAPLHNYEDAPATPDADDPAIWIDRRVPGRFLVIGTAKDAGLLVYNAQGELRQAVLPPNAPQISPEDPDTPADNAEPDNPCPESASGETFGRFNNVDIAYGVRLGGDRADVAVVSDRGCDRVRFYRIDPDAAAGPLIDITAHDVPRVFPERFEQPSPLQPSDVVEGWRDNPVDDQNTVYGLTVAQHDGHDGHDAVFVSQRERGLVRQLAIIVTPEGALSYRVTRTFLFRTSFVLRDSTRAAYDWTPCREAALEEPQSEGLVFDAVSDTLYVAFETIGLYRLPLQNSRASFTVVTADELIEPVQSFGLPYRAIPDDDEFECVYGAADEAEPNDVVAIGSTANAGSFLQADLEGLSVVASDRGRTLLLASSQGDSSFHFYEITRGRVRHRGLFFVAGVEDTDGVHYVPRRLAPDFPNGLLVVQNGAAPGPSDTSDVNGFGYDGSTQFMYVDFADTLAALTRSFEQLRR